MVLTTAIQLWNLYSYIYPDWFQKETHLEKDIQKLEKSNKSQEDCMIVNSKKAELKTIQKKKEKKTPPCMCIIMF